MTTLNLFRQATNVETYTAGQVIFQEGQPGNVMYVVQAGQVDILLNGLPFDLAGPGDIFGEMALIDDRPRSATAVAATDCTLVPIDERRFAFLVQQTPNFALTVMRVMADRLRKRMRKDT
jgi:CRP/FNR family transcriptional regulator, cyclic AMP receptor protein